MKNPLRRNRTGQPTTDTDLTPRADKLARDIVNRTPGAKAYQCTWCNPPTTHNAFDTGKNAARTSNYTILYLREHLLDKHRDKL